MDKKSKIVSNKNQLARLVQLMQEHPDIGKGICGKAQAKSRWEVITTDLNSLGPPLRSWEKWLKVWTDLKSKTKKKMFENKAEFRATGGGPNNLHTFTPLEEVVSNFLKFDVCINPPGQEFGTVEMQSSAQEPITGVSGSAEADDEMQETQECEVLNPQGTKKKNNLKKAVNQKRITFLEKQVNSQAKYYDTMKEHTRDIKESLKNIGNAITKSYRLQKDMFSLNKKQLDLKKEKLKLFKEELLNKQKNRSEKLKLKIEVMQFQKENISSIIL